MNISRLHSVDTSLKTATVNLVLKLKAHGQNPAFAEFDPARIWI